MSVWGGGGDSGYVLANLGGWGHPPTLRALPFSFIRFDGNEGEWSGGANALSWSIWE